MREIKREKMREIIHRLAAEFVRNEAGDTSLLTITRVEISPTGKESKIYFTTLPENLENTALKFLIRKTPEFNVYVRNKSRLGMVPHIDFKIDYGERHRQKLDELSEEH
ncbi:MAG: ribosome-binding factor A [Candidatus Zambryskibacteria bacterium]|nr:ribosome-binding factor A [Candidatus Zambryskibacteria bacterium]